MDKMTKAQRELLEACKLAKLNVCVGIEIAVACKEDEASLKMAEYIRNNTGVDDETLIEKAYEIAGKEKPEIVIED